MQSAGAWALAEADVHPPLSQDGKKNLDAATVADATDAFGTLASRPDATRRMIPAAVIDNTLEWFDFAVYGFFAILFKLFFPTGDETSSLLLTVATFGVGFVMRPIGAVILGALGDTHGAQSRVVDNDPADGAWNGNDRHGADVRRCGPLGARVDRTGEADRASPPAAKVGGRQRFSSSTRRKIARATSQAGSRPSQAGALLLGSLFGATLTGVLSPQQLEAWGWRIPFLFGTVIGPVGWYIRAKTREPATFERAKAANQQASPLRQVMGSYLKSSPGSTSPSCGRCARISFWSTCRRTPCALKLPQSASLWANGAGLEVLVVLAPVSAGSRTRSRRRPLVGFAAAILVLAYPALWLLTAFPSAATLTAVLVVFAVLIAGFTGPLPPWPKAIRRR